MSYHEELAAEHRARRERLAIAALPPISPAVLLPHSVPVNLLTEANWRVLLKLVSAKHGIPTRDILGPSHSPPIVAARFEAMHLIHTHMSKSFPLIGRLFNRDHTSVIHAVRKVERERSAKKSGQILVVNGRRTNISGVSTGCGAKVLERQVSQVDSARNDEGVSFRPSPSSQFEQSALAERAPSSTSVWSAR